MYKYRCLHSCLVILPFSVSNIPKMSHHICEFNVLASWAYNAGSCKISHVYDRESNWPHKTGSRYNDTLSCVGKPNGSVTMSQKYYSYSCLILLHTMWFSAKNALEVYIKAHWRYFYSPLVTGIRVKWKTAWQAFEIIISLISIVWNWLNRVELQKT